MACKKEWYKLTKQSEPSFSIKQLKYLIFLLPNSADLLAQLADSYLIEDYKTKSNRYKNEPLNLYKKSFIIDPNNLNTLRRSTKHTYSTSDYANLKFNQYCKKAVEMKQWDHIFYIADKQGLSPDRIAACLGELPGSSCSCPEAMKLMLSGLSKGALLSSINIDPAGEDPPEGYIEDSRKWIKKMMKKHFGRDLDKEKGEPDF